jgi:riboflavin synthase
MFTGIIEDVGVLRRTEKDGTGGHLTVVTRLASAGGIGLGDSVAVDGCCLTATRVDEHSFDADLSAETIARTAFGRLEPGAKVNLERSLPAGGRMGGHVVQGHVDGVGEVVEVRVDGETRIVTFRVPAEHLPYLAEKGSVAVDGTSLTVNGLTRDGFHVTLVPFTLEHTTLGALKPAHRVNIETDVMAKYVVRALSFTRESPHA